MTDQVLDQIFDEIVKEIEMKSCCKEGQADIRNKLEELKSMDVWTDEDKRERNDRGRYLLYMMESGEKPLKKSSKAKSDNCCGKCHSNDASSSRAPSSGKGFLDQLEPPTTDLDAIASVIDRVGNKEITTTAEFIFNIKDYVEDRGAVLQGIFEKNLQLFREIVEDTIDRRMQDDCDVMMHTQNNVKQKLQTLREAMERRIKKIKKRLLEISPDYDWSTDGKNREKIMKLIVKPHQQPETKEEPDDTEKLIHQVLIRGQWLKKELSRLQEENANLKVYLDKFRSLAKERKVQEEHVPRMLKKEKKHLESKLAKQRKTYKQNLEIIDDLYIDYRTYVANSDNNYTDSQQHGCC